MWYWVFRAIFAVILKLFFRLRAEGLNNLPKTNFIIVANHASFLDPLVIMAAVPRKIYCIALKGLYRLAWLGWFLRSVDALPNGCSSDKATCLLAENKNVGLFPEGGISRNGQLRNFKRGVALLALRTGRPIVPCAIFGAYESLPVGAKFPRFLPIKVRIGRPIYFPKEFEDVIDDISLQEGVLRIRQSIQEMLYAGQ